MAPAPRPCVGPDLPPADLLAAVLDAPPAGDRWRFPPPEVVSRSAWFAYRFRCKLLERIPWEPDRAGLIRQAHRDCWAHWYAWEILFYIDHGDRSKDWRIRLRLAELRELIGPEAYSRGLMPEPVPGILFSDLR